MLGSYNGNVSLLLFITIYSPLLQLTKNRVNSKQMEQLNQINLPKVDSTNTFVRDMLESGESLPGITLVTAYEQTAGRGQAGNTWESEAGKNLLFSLLCHPSFIVPSEQFVLSECMALAIQQVLSRRIAKAGREDEVTIKWPNDIYVGDRKICGTLIECDLMGKTVSNCIIGTGINVNQTVFTSDAPNPVSLKQITGTDTDASVLLTEVVDLFCEYYELVHSGKRAEVEAQYMANLYRRTGLHRYCDVRGEFMAEIAGVEPTGHLVLRFDTGNTVRYEFKEVKFVI